MAWITFPTGTCSSRCATRWCRRQARIEGGGIELLDHCRLGITREPELRAQPPINRRQCAKKTPQDGKGKAVAASEPQQRHASVASGSLSGITLRTTRSALDFNSHEKAEQGACAGRMHHGGIERVFHQSHDFVRCDQANFCIIGKSLLQRLPNVCRCFAQKSSPAAAATMSAWGASPEP